MHEERETRVCGVDQDGAMAPVSGAAESIGRPFPAIASTAVGVCPRWHEPREPDARRAPRKPWAWVSVSGGRAPSSLGSRCCPARALAHL